MDPTFPDFLPGSRSAFGRAVTAWCVMADTHTAPTRPGTTALRWLVRRWPTWTAFALVIVTGFDLDDGRALGFLLILSPLGYLVPSAVGRRGVTWIAVVAGIAAVVAMRAVGLDETVGLLVAAVGFAVLGVVRAAPGHGLQVAGAIGFAVVALLAVHSGHLVGGYLVAAGLIGHAAWDVYHHWRDRVVSRSFAEWCAVVDVLLAVAVFLAVIGHTGTG